MSLDNISTHSRTVSALFDTQGAAQKAVDDLISAGIPREQISVTGGQGAARSATPTATEDKGFWESLQDLFLPEEDRYSYAEGLRRGGYLLTVKTDQTHYERVLDILDTDGSVNMDEREGTWRSEGWSGFSGASQAGLMSGAAGASSLNASTDYRTDTAARAAATGTQTRPLGSTAATGSGREEVIPVYEEQMRIGKRDVNHGRVRVRSYVVETPVNEQVNLRSENVQVDRRPVDRPVSASDALFKDRVIEAEEHVEEAVVAKEARVKEEITLRKTAEERVQNVTDSVRHTEVEVEDQRGAGLAARGARSFSAATDSARIAEHMDVIDAGGQKIGTVDHVEGSDRIKLAKTTSPDGQHHYVPLAWVDHVDRHVHLNRSGAEVKAAW